MPTKILCFHLSLVVREPFPFSVFRPLRRLQRVFPFCRYYKCRSIGMEPSWVMTPEEREEQQKVSPGHLLTPSGSELSSQALKMKVAASGRWGRNHGVGHTELRMMCHLSLII